ncbi:Fur family transcriptional regulator [Flavonifractor plautii]|uniref:Transcriptional repressor n=1 Tax=Flavonifractor plautii TaxID=292800 RepID=A0AAX1KKI0_FLAPL|nr:transcriptional repressor [Flavonifractor plautii]QQR06454.1 transcriptional repressor [Flavonifractor plautii]UQA27212.1 transcriptional repressor [Flavonifractor plautii]
MKKDTAFTAESVWRGLLEVEEKVGRATVYRALDRLVEAGTILKIPSGDGNRALYRYMGEAALPSSGRMVCLDCGRAFPLECSHLEELTRHIQSDHQFEVDTRHTVLYGHCCDCGK